MDTTKIGRFIRELREEKNYTQKDLGEKLGCEDKTISKWETGNGLPDTMQFPAIAKLFGITIEELFAGERSKALNLPLLGRAVNEGLEGLYKLKRENSELIFREDDERKNLIDYCILLNKDDLLCLLIDYCYDSTRKYNTSTLFRKLEEARKSLSDEEILKVQEELDLSEKLSQIFSSNLKYFIGGNAHKILVYLIEKKQFEQALLIKKHNAVPYGEDYGVMAIQNGLSFEKAKLFGGNIVPLKKIALGQDSFYEEKRKEFFAQIILMKDPSKASNIKFDYDFIEQAFNNQDDDVVLALLENKIEQYKKMSMPEAYMYNHMFDTSLKYFIEHDKKELFKRILNNPDYQLAFFRNRLDECPLLYKFIENTITPEEGSFLREYALAAIKNPEIKLTMANQTDKSIYKYVFENEDSEMYDCLVTYRNQLTEENQIEVKYNRIVYEESFNAKNGKPFNANRIVDFCKENKNKAAICKMILEKYDKEGIPFEKRLIDLYTNVPPSIFIFKEWIPAIIKIKNYGFFIKAISNCDFRLIESYIRDQAISFGDLRKINWIIENITNNLSNSDIVLLYKLMQVKNVA